MRTKKFKSNKPLRVIGFKVPDCPKIISQVRAAVENVLKPHLNK